MSARSVKCCPALKRNASCNSYGTSKRIDIASSVSGTTSATRSGWKCSAMSALPDGVGIGARQILHHRQQMPEMLAVMPSSSAEDRALIGRYIQLGFGQYRANRRAILAFEAARVGHRLPSNHFLE